MINDLSITEEDIEKLTILAIKMEEIGSIDEAIALYKIGVNLGDLICTTRLADILSEPPVFKNVPLAEYLYKRACIAGHAPACRNLAILYGQLGKSALSTRYMKLAKDRGDVWQID